MLPAPLRPLLRDGRIIRWSRAWLVRPWPRGASAQSARPLGSRPCISRTRRAATATPLPVCEHFFPPYTGTSVYNTHAKPAGLAACIHAPLPLPLRPRAAVLLAELHPSRWWAPMPLLKLASCPACLTIRHAPPTLLKYPLLPQHSAYWVCRQRCLILKLDSQCGVGLSLVSPPQNHTAARRPRAPQRSPVVAVYSGPLFLDTYTSGYAARMPAVIIDQITRTWIANEAAAQPRLPQNSPIRGHRLLQPCLIHQLDAPAATWGPCPLGGQDPTTWTLLPIPAI